MNEIIYCIWLNSKDLNQDKKMNLLKIFGNAENVYKAQPKDYCGVNFLSPENITLLSDKDLSFAENDYNGCIKLGVRIICYGSNEYPPALLDITDPPILLYAKGDLTLLQNRLAFCFVGTRKATEYGLAQTMRFSSYLAERGFVIVSGCALGIDSAAHKGALIAHGKTIGVMGCGLDVDYPSGNKALRKEILEKGLLISECPLSTPAHGYNFPKRNRILSGLSLGVAVMEAGFHSGSLITAEFANAQGKDVYALPGKIDSVFSAGCNNLIYEGCEMLLDPDTIVGEYLERYSECFVSDPENQEDTISETVEKIVSGFSHGMSDEEKAILRLLRNGEQHIDFIASALKLPTSKAASLLTALQIKKLILETPGKYYKLY